MFLWYCVIVLLWYCVPGQFNPLVPFPPNNPTNSLDFLHALQTHSSFAQSLKRSLSSMRERGVKPQSSSPKRSSVADLAANLDASRPIGGGGEDDDDDDDDGDERRWECYGKSS